MERVIDALEPIASHSGMLREALALHGIKARVDDGGEVVFSFHCIDVRIAPRPAHCDRGRWLVHAQSSDPTRAVIDHSDMFPRYYFHDVSLCMEMRAWKKARMRHLERRR